jgi:hypothetical protein
MSSSESWPEKSDSIRLMAHALDRVFDHLPSSVECTDEVRRDVALFIVDHFRLGEHDPDHLSDLALAMLCPSGDELKDHKLVSIPDKNEIAPTE